MTAYRSFSLVYDIFMEDTPYDLWVSHIEHIFKQYTETSPKLVLDMACGTGSITERLVQKRYDMIGVDISTEMLMAAREKLPTTLFLNQDIRDMDLFGTVDAAVCLCDGINYLLTEKDVLKTFMCVNNYLNPKGLFIFDVNTEHKFKNVLGNNTFAATDKNAAYIWENFYDEKKKVNTYDVTFFIKEKNAYQRYSEVHRQKVYSEGKLKSLLQRSGLKLLNIYDAETLLPPTEVSERLIIVTQEILKENI